ncbi:hypothetical protein Tel_03715 [Candidatus Tenderia electrophaga]|jgi:diguanylate cyclase (GGDEF)-like protein/PAS domain S-box-containing protein|uniref:cyclic-guanylate-specific phosphodiesterase n=1 Tax=Candidatus Tenderia electrophaga TaxID=1748243 RepID=A0A0S2TAX6_9GAMM|nr:hypothetical protein Tel_03715 [Candidatus Tenderia electrophaga]
MQTQREPGKLQRRLLILAAGGTILTALLVAISVAVPLYQHNKQQHQQRLMAATTSLALAANEHLKTLGIIAAQISSRSHARTLLQQYRNKQLDLAELRSQTRPILEDAMAGTPQIVGITRLDRDATPLVAVGHTPAKQAWLIPQDEDRGPSIGPIFQVETQRVFLVGTPILSSDGERIGTDIVTFSATPLLQLFTAALAFDHGETVYLGVLDNGQLTVISPYNGTAQPDQPFIGTALDKALQGESGVMAPGTNGNNEGAITAYAPITRHPPWALALSVDASKLYAPLREQAVVILIIVAALILVAMALIIHILRPLTGRMMIHTSELQQQINKNTIDLQRSNRALSAISACSNALVHARDEKDLLRDICNIIVAVGGYRLAWIGYAQDDDAKSVLPAAQAGFDDHYLDNARLSWSEDDPRGRGPGGTSIRSGAPCIVRDVLNDARFEPWRDEATQRGFASVIGLPLTYEDRAFGTLLIYAAERDAFDPEEVRLLRELTDDLAYGIMMLRTREERQWAEQELIDSEERWRSLTENSPDHILTLNAALRIEFANHAAPGQRVEDLIGTCILDYVENPFKRREVESKLRTTLSAGAPCSYETEHTAPDGDIIYYESRVAPRIVDGDIVGLTLSTRDITQRKRDEAQIQHLAYHDELTGLPNRRLLMDRLDHSLAIARRHHTKGALLFLDLDRFKTINDSLGHAVGDAVLCEVAKRLSQHVRAEDSVARLGGDEFMVLLPELKNDDNEASYEASVVAEKLRHSLSQPYFLNGHQYHTTPSIGVVIFPFVDESADDILKHADTAMYRAKAAGRDEIRFYRPSMQEAVDQRLGLEKDLRAALQEESFQLHYQPLMDNDHRVVGAEALLRWHHPQRGWVSPEEFIPVAEETGIILPLGDWVMQQAIAQVKQWQSHSWAQQTGFMAINISARQFHQSDFVADITRALERHGVQPDYLKLELTESLVIEDIVDTVAKMEALRELGVHIAIDDFGTGYSSLAYLKRLPIDQIKIDKSFVLDLTTDRNDAAIVETIISVARHLSLGVVAEGVETVEVLQALKQNLCYIFQGYYFSQPLPGPAFVAMVENNQTPEPA